MPYDRHCKILECIQTTLDTAIAANASGYFLQDTVLPARSFVTRIEDFDRTEKPDVGIIISPEREEEKMSLNNSSDIEYSCLVTRVTHSLSNDDKQQRLAFRAMMRILFHQKKLSCVTGCLIVSKVDFGDVKSRRDWDRDNMSVNTVRVKMLVRESLE